MKSCFKFSKNNRLSASCQTLWKAFETWKKSIKTFVCLYGMCQWAPPSDLLFFLLTVPSESDGRMLSFLFHCQIPLWWPVNDVVVGALWTCFAPLSVDCVLTPILCKAEWLTILILLCYSIVLVIWTMLRLR